MLMVVRDGMAMAMTMARVMWRRYYVPGVARSHEPEMNTLDGGFLAIGWTIHGENNEDFEKGVLIIDGCSVSTSICEGLVLNSLLGQSACKVMT